MTLADKIMLLRKQKGWSQIDLADRLDVSRQSVSKWEMAQVVPELDKIVKLSELFNVTTDYLLKDSEADTLPPPPDPEPESPPEPEPISEPVPESATEPAKKKWPTWRKVALFIAAAVFAVSAVVILAAATFSYIPQRNEARNASGTPIPLPMSDIQPTPVPQTADVYEGAAAVSDTTPAPVPQGASDTADNWTIQAVSTDETYEGPAMETYTYTNGQTAVDGGPILPGDMLTIAKEYEPFGVSYDERLNQWYYEGEPVRVFTDVLFSNGQPLEAGTFRGTIRNYAGTGTVDIRTVRDYDNLTDEGFGTLTGIEKFQVDADAAWQENP